MIKVGDFETASYAFPRVSIGCRGSAATPSPADRSNYHSRLAVSESFAYDIGQWKITPSSNRRSQVFSAVSRAWRICPDGWLLLYAVCVYVAARIAATALLLALTLTRILPMAMLK